MTNIAMGNGPFIDGLPFLKMVDLSMAMLNNQMVVISSLRLALWLRILHTYGSEFSTRVPHLVSDGN